MKGSHIEGDAMGKVNFKKAEHLLEEGIRSYGVKQLLFLAELSASFGKNRKLSKANAFDDKEIKAISLMTLARNVKELTKRDKDALKHLGIKKREIEKYVDNPELLTAEDWEKVDQIRRRLADYRKEMQKKFEKVSDEDIINSERKKHINKRFNVNNTWLPLH